MPTNYETYINYIGMKFTAPGPIGRLLSRNFLAVLGLLTFSNF